MLFTVALGAIGLLAASAATFWAFKPLRVATGLIGLVGPHDLDGRLADRGTNDPHDTHARRLNQTLSAIEISFSRLRSFSNDVAHEFRTPLNRIATIADVAVGGNDQEARDALASIRATAAELSRLVDSMLMIAEVENRAAAIDRKPIDVVERLTNVAALYEPAFADRDSPLRTNLSTASIMGAPELFDRVIVNLLENALQHTAPGTQIEISCGQRDGHVTIAVEDSGDGIPQSELDSIFDRFVRMSSNSTKGYGLGLALSRSIARFHGGDLIAETSRLGGARLVWWMPVQ